MRIGNGTALIELTEPAYHSPGRAARTVRLAVVPIVRFRRQRYPHCGFGASGPDAAFRPNYRLLPSYWCILPELGERMQARIRATRNRP